MESPSQIQSFYLCIYQDEDGSPLVWFMESSLPVACSVGKYFITFLRCFLFFCHDTVCNFPLLTQTDAVDPEGEEEVVDLFTTPRTKLAAATSDFGYNLFRQLAARDPKASVFLSPMSISTSFTQLSMGEALLHFGMPCFSYCRANHPIFTA